MRFKTMTCCRVQLINDYYYPGTLIMSRTLYMIPPCHTLKWQSYSWPATSRCLSAAHRRTHYVGAKAGTCEVIQTKKKRQNKQTWWNSNNEDSVMSRGSAVASCSSFVRGICCPLKQVLMHLQSQGALMGRSIFSVSHMLAHIRQWFPAHTCDSRSHAALLVSSKKGGKKKRKVTRINMCRSIFKAEWRCARLRSFNPETCHTRWQRWICWIHVALSVSVNEAHGR